ncbi:MAG: beta-xylosidase [Verrucomicrobia bacterium]|nr:beta-xylosidase [Verrucomicrobiota bacterium]
MTADSSSNLDRRTFLHLVGGVCAVSALDASPRNLQAAEGSAAADRSAFPVAIRVDAGRALGALKPIWRFFGADEPNYATMQDGRKLLADLGKLRPRETYFRTHNLLCTGDGTAVLKWGSTNIYTEDAQGNPVYDWTIVDSIFDAYLERGVRPLVQLGFMPQALSIHPEPYQHHWRPGLPYKEIIAGWAYPPKDYDKWRELIFQWTKHCLERYGREEVEQWYWEVWNEPNSDYWKGTREEFHKLYDYAVDGLRRALPKARVGGAHTAGPGGEFQREFLTHCLRGTNYATGEAGTPLDFVAFHAKGAPTFADGHVRMGIASQLRALDGGFAIAAAFPELKGVPVIIGESDPDGCAACQGPQLGYRNTTMYASYTAAVFARHHDLAAQRGVNLEGAVTWAFEFEDQPYFAGFRVLASHGLTLPVFNVFRMFSKLGGKRIAAESSAAANLEVMMKEGVRSAPDVAALASRDGKKLGILCWHYHDDDFPGPAAAVSLEIQGIPKEVARVHLHHFRIDHEHSNAFTAWQRLGAPQSPSAQQYAELEKASLLAQLEPVREMNVENGQGVLCFALPRQAVSLVMVEWE